MNDPAGPGKPTQVGEALESLENTIARGVELCAVMEDRILRILMPNETPPETKKQEPSTAIVSLAVELDRMQSGVDLICDRLQSFLDRCEL